MGARGSRSANPQASPQSHQGRCQHGLALGFGGLGQGAHDGGSGIGVAQSPAGEFVPGNVGSAHIESEAGSRDLIGQTFGAQSPSVQEWNAEFANAGVEHSTIPRSRQEEGLPERGMQGPGSVLFHHENPLARGAQARCGDQSADAAPEHDGVPSGPLPGCIRDPGEAAHQVGGLKPVSRSNAGSSGSLRSICPIV